MTLSDFEVESRNSKLGFRFLTPEEVDNYWKVLLPYIASVVNRAGHGEFTENNIRVMATHGQIVIGIGHRGIKKGFTPEMVVGMELVWYPSATAVNVLAMAGRGVDEFMRDIMPKFAKWLTGKVDWIECSVSPGMERIHSRYGFETVYRNMRYYLKEI